MTELDLSTLKAGDTAFFRCAVSKKITEVGPRKDDRVLLWFSDDECMWFNVKGFVNTTYSITPFDIIRIEPAKPVREGKVYAVIDNTVDEGVYLTTNPSKMFINSTLAVIELGSWREGDGLNLLRSEE